MTCRCLIVSDGSVDLSSAPTPDSWADSLSDGVVNTDSKLTARSITFCGLAHIPTPIPLHASLQSKLTFSRASTTTMSYLKLSRLHTK